jgi:hypothetical protein
MLRSPATDAADGYPMVARRRRFVLTPTQAGTNIDANGRIEVRAHAAERHFEAGLDAAVSDGTTFVVLANGEPAGTITMAGGSGDLHVSNLEGVLPNGIAPLTALTSVEITDGRGTVILVGRL